METYIGTKIIKARPMNRLEYNGYRGWELPEDEQHLADEDGMLVEYEDTNHPNVEGHEGYVSWSPLDVFVEAYVPMEGMTFGMAIESLKMGKKVAREGWNGKDMFLFLVPGSTFNVSRPPLLGIYPEGTEINYCPHIDMKTADDKVVPWLASQTDILASDWCTVE
jgi:hypothetical protein